MAKVSFVACGALFGFALSRGRATDWDTIAAMFRLTDLHLVGVLGSAIVVIALGYGLLARGSGVTVGGRPIEFKPKPWHGGAVWGGLVFGVGWALSGACPGTVLAQVGEGKLVALVTVAGILLGTYLYGWVRSHSGRPSAAGLASPARS